MSCNRNPIYYVYPNKDGSCRPVQINCPTGYTGYTGAAGHASSTGATGYTGYTGYIGATGYTGYTGISILSGTVDPDGSLGGTNDLYLNTTTCDLYKKSETTVPSSRSLPTTSTYTGNTIYVGSTRTYTTIQSAINAASNYDILYLDSETFTISSTISVNKPLYIRTASSSGAIVVCTSDINLFDITSNDVFFQYIEFQHNAASVDKTILSFNTYTLTGIYVDSCRFYCSEFSILLGLSEGQFSNNYFDYSLSAPASNTYRHFLIYRHSGQTFIINNTCNVPTYNTQRCQFIYLTDRGSPATDTFTGSLIIDGNICTGSGQIRNFLLQDMWYIASANIYITNNQIPNIESSGDVVFYGPSNTSNFLSNQYQTVYITNNSGYNFRGKGFVAFDDTIGTNMVIGTPSFINISNNVLTVNGITDISYASAMNDGSAQSGYKTSLYLNPNFINSTAIQWNLQTNICGSTGYTGYTGAGVSSSTFQNSITISATTSAPTLGARTIDQINYRSVGDKRRICYRLGWAAGTAGSGDYLYTLPTGITFNTASGYNPTYTGVLWSPSVSAMAPYLISMTGGIVQPANWSTHGGYIIPYSSTTFRVAFTNNNTNTFNIHSSSWQPFTTEGQINMEFEIFV